MKKLIKAKTKKGRPAKGDDPFGGIRLPAEMIARVDAWAENVVAKSRSEAICRLVEIGLRASVVEIGIRANRKRAHRGQASAAFSRARFSWSNAS